MAAYKVGAEGGHAGCQWQVGIMYCNGRGVDMDYAQALPWIEKAAAQDYPSAVGQLGVMYCDGGGVTSSWRRAREYYERAIELGFSDAVGFMQTLTEDIQQVTSRRSIHTAPSSLVRDRFHTKPPSPLTLAARPPHGQAGGAPRHEPRGYERQARRRHRLSLL